MKKLINTIKKLNERDKKEIREIALNWEKWRSGHSAKKGNYCSWKKRMLKIGKNSIDANILEWNNRGDNEKHYELTIQIPEELSITGVMIDINSYSYKDLNFGKPDFERIDKDCMKIIKRLVK